MLNDMQSRRVCLNPGGFTGMCTTEKLAGAIRTKDGLKWCFWTRVNSRTLVFPRGQQTIFSDQRTEEWEETFTSTYSCSETAQFQQYNLNSRMYYRHSFLMYCKTSHIYKCTELMGEKLQIVKETLNFSSHHHRKINFPPVLLSHCHT